MKTSQNYTVVMHGYMEGDRGHKGQNLKKAVSKPEKHLKNLTKISKSQEKNQHFKYECQSQRKVSKLKRKNKILNMNVKGLKNSRERSKF